MDENKQIEEMVKIIVDGCREWSCEKCKYSECALYPDCVPQFTAEALYNAGYRKQEWISVEERLPEVGEKVLVYSKSEDFYGIGQYSKYLKKFCVMRIDGENVTHWMPLPQPPKGE